MDGLGLMEVTEIRGFAKGVENNLRRLSKVKEENENDASRLSGEDDDEDNIEIGA